MAPNRIVLTVVDTQERNGMFLVTTGETPQFYENKNSTYKLFEVELNSDNLIVATGDIEYSLALNTMPTMTFFIALGLELGSDNSLRQGENFEFFD